MSLKVRIVQKIALFLLLFPVFDVKAAPVDAPKPWNVIIFTADDMNGDSPGWMGNPLKPTPNLDAFASTAFRFVNHHVTVPICQPSRSALMTGRVPHRNGALGFNPIHVGVPTLVKMLKEKGYQTSVIDKFPHMMPESEFPWDSKGRQSGKNPPLFKKQVEEAIQASKAAGKPLFLNANITDPHRPFPGGDSGKMNAKKKVEGSDENQGRPLKVFKPDEIRVPSFLEDIPDVRREIAQYYTAVSRLDQTFLGAMEALRAADMEKNSIILFLSDHGMSMPFSKASVYRNGTWSPLLVRFPKMPVAKTMDEFVSSVDILPTILDVLGMPHPQGLDGRSLLPLMEGEKQAGRDYVVTHVNTVSSGKSFPQRCIRARDYSLHFHAWTNGQPIFRVEAMNGITFNALANAGKNNPAIQARVSQYQVGVPLALYDLTNDPDERKNLLNESRVDPKFEQMAALLMDHMEKTNDPQTMNFKKALQARKAAEK